MRSFIERDRGLCHASNDGRPARASFDAGAGVRLVFATHKTNNRPGGSFMKRALIGLMLLAASPALAQDPVKPVPSIAFDSVPNPLRLPEDMYFGGSFR